MKKKILFVIQSLRMGGAERVLVTLANKLVENGCDVTILIWLAKYEFRDDLDSRVRLIYKAPDQHLGNRIPYIRYKFYDDCMWIKRATPRQIHRYYVGREKYDVEIAFFHSLALDIVAGSTDKKSKKIAWIHNNLEELSTNSALQKAKELYHQIRNIVCVSKASRDSFLRIIGDTGSVSVIYNMLPIEEIRRKALLPRPQEVKKAPFHIVMVARLHAPKGYRRLIDTVLRLKREGRDLSLALVGEGDDEDLIRSIIRDNRADDYISVVNGRNNPYPYIREADLLVCSSYAEGYNLTLGEAMVLGVPVLSTDCAGPREILDGGKYGMLVENSDKGLYEGIGALYDSPDLLESFRKKAAQRQDFFDEEKILRQVTALFEG